MEDRVLMAKFSSKWVIDPMEAPICSCSELLHEGEVVALYPVDEIDPSVRDIVCMTCHFWFVHYAMENEEAEEAA